MHPALRQQALFSFNKANCDGDYPILTVIFFDKIENFSAFYFMRLLESLHCKPIFLDLGVIIVSVSQMILIQTQR